MKKIYRWKFLTEEFKSKNGNCVWDINKWKTYDGELSMCRSGFHASKKVSQAFSYVQGEILARVEVAGEHLVDNDGTKEVWKKMRVAKTYKWQQEDSVALAIFSAELVINIYEKQYPNDDRPKRAIEAARRWLKDPTLYAANDAGAAAYAAAAAARVANAAARAAYAAAYAAYAAAYAAANAAYAAARAADTAADVADIVLRISDWMEKRVKKLEVLS